MNEFDERQPASNQSTILIEGGDFDDEPAGEIDEENEPNFNRVDGAPVVHASAGQHAGGARPQGGPGGPGGRRRRRRGRGPGSSGGRS
jgi:polyribonucleotide nucleotidyltransferase